MDKQKIHIQSPVGEIHVRMEDLDPNGWITFPTVALRQYFLWVHPTTGASIALIVFVRSYAATTAESDMERSMSRSIAEIERVLSICLSMADSDAMPGTSFTSLADQSRAAASSGMTGPARAAPPPPPAAPTPVTACAACASTPDETISASMLEGAW